MAIATYKMNGFQLKMKPVWIGDKQFMEYVASLSGGKDSLAMTLRLLEENRPLTKIVFFDTGMEFDAIVRNVRRVEKLASDIELVTLKPSMPFMLQMMAKPVKGGEHYGYDWCGGRCRWMTSEKVQVINKYLSTLGGYQQYIGIAADEAHRAKEGIIYPLIEWNMTEKDCLAYCRKHGFDWDEDGVDLYDVLDRVSCWCCGNKNLKELRAMKKYLPKYWGLLKGLQSRIDRPFRHEASIFDLDARFEKENKQMELDLGA